MTSKYTILPLYCILANQHSIYSNAFLATRRPPLAVGEMRHVLLDTTMNPKIIVTPRPSLHLTVLYAAHSSITSQEEVPYEINQAIHRFFFDRDHGPLCMVVTIICTIIYRINLHQQHVSLITVDDFFAFALSIMFWWLQEHFIHQKLLHSKFNWYGKSIHQEHHSKPYFHISIDPPALMLAWLGTTYLFIRLVAPLSLSLSAILGYAMAGMGYEFIHYLVHTKVKMKSDYLKSVKDLHIRHHLVSDDNYFSFQIPLIDDLMGTNPSITDVRQKKNRIQ